MTELTSCVEAARGAELICVCCNCHRERTPTDEWRAHDPATGERLTHGICPECLYELYPDVAPLVYPRN